MNRFAVIALLIGTGALSLFANVSPANVSYDLTAVGTESNGQAVGIFATLNLSPIGGGIYQVVGAVGTVADPWGGTVSITGVQNGYVDPFSHDNLVSIPAGYTAAGSSGNFFFDSNGLLFSTNITTPGDAYYVGIAPDEYYNDGQYQFADTGANVAGNGPGGQVNYTLGNWPYDTADLTVTFTRATLTQVAPTPEPGFYTLLALGLIGLATVVSHRKRAKAQI